VRVVVMPKKPKYVRDIIEVVLAFAVAWLFYQGLAMATGTPMPIVSVESESMEPILHKGDLVFIVSPENLKIKDIIIYEPMPNCFETQKTIIHRIIGFADDGKFIIKGDHNPIPDRCTVDKSQVRGKVIFVIPILGYPRTFVYDAFHI
jgi:signal peptidase